MLYRTSAAPIFVDELNDLAQRRGLVVWGLPGRRRAPDSWLGSGVEAPTDLAALTSWVPDVAERDVFVCGPRPWTDLVLPRPPRRRGARAAHPPRELWLVRPVKRIVLWVLSTLSAVVVLFGYHTSTSSVMATGSDGAFSGSLTAGADAPPAPGRSTTPAATPPLERSQAPRARPSPATSPRRAGAPCRCSSTCPGRRSRT